MHDRKIKNALKMLELITDKREKRHELKSNMPVSLSVNENFVYCSI
jgi:hypothetical protein